MKYVYGNICNERFDKCNVIQERIGAHNVCMMVFVMIIENTNYPLCLLPSFFHQEECYESFCIIIWRCYSQGKESYLA